MKKLLYTPLFVLIWVFLGAATIFPDSARQLFPVKEKGKWGFIDGKGRIAVRPKYDRVKEFSEGVAAVAVFGKKHIDESAGLQPGDLRWGYIDESGKTRIALKYDFANSFHNGLALVGLHNSVVRTPIVSDYQGPLAEFVYINKSGKIAFESSIFVSKDDFSEGRALVGVGDKFGFIDVNGHLAVEPIFDEARRFSQGMAAINIGAKPNFRAWRGRVGGKWGYIDKRGHMLVEPQFEDAGRHTGNAEFAEGVVHVKVGNKFGYVDGTGKMVIEPRFDFAVPFSEGLALVKLGKKWMYINKTGDPTVQVEDHIHWPQSFSEGLAVFVNAEGTPNKGGYMDKSGRIVIRPIFDQAYPFSGGLARVELWEEKPRVYPAHVRVGYINPSGDYVWKPRE